MEKQDFGKAEHYFNSALRINPKSIPAHYNMACFYALQDNSEESLFWLKKAIALGFKNRELLKSDPDLKNIRKTPDFKKILGDINAW